MTFRAQTATSPEETDLVLFKMLLIQKWYSLEDGATVAEVSDRISLRRFCGLELDEPVPDAEALRSYRLRLANAEGRALLTEISRRPPEGLAAAPGDEPLLSVVSPVYRAAEIVGELVRRTSQEVSRITPDFEILLVDDGSPDDAWSRIEEACATDPRVKGIRLSRNFGQHQAITAGLDHARGRWVVVMDCDLQDDPCYIRDLYEKALEGYDIVYTCKESREHGRIKNLLARVFFVLLNRLTSGPRADARVGSFSLISRRAAEAFRQVGDVHRHYLGVLRWLGFRSTEIPIRHQQRYAGKTSYSLGKLLRHAVDGLTSQSDRLLYGAVAAGFLCLLASIAGTALLTVLYLIYGFKEGWTSTIVLILLTTSAILSAIGVVGIYVGKIFDQVKQRPLYLVQDEINLSGAGRKQGDQCQRS